MVVIGLLIIGLGLSVPFPLALSRLLRASSGRPDATANWATLGAGVASGCAPFALGVLSDGGHQFSAPLLLGSQTAVDHPIC